MGFLHLLLTAILFRVQLGNNSSKEVGPSPNRQFYSPPLFFYWHLLVLRGLNKSGVSVVSIAASLVRSILGKARLRLLFILLVLVASSRTTTRRFSCAELPLPNTGTRYRTYHSTPHSCNLDFLFFHPTHDRCQFSSPPPRSLIYFSFSRRKFSRYLPPRDQPREALSASPFHSNPIPSTASLA